MCFTPHMKKPTKPVNKKSSCFSHIGNETLDCIIEKAKLLNVPFGEIEITQEWEPYCDDPYIAMQYPSYQYTEEEFAEKLAHYEEGLEAYNEWADINKTMLAADAADRKKVKKAKKLAELEKQRKDIEAKIKNLE